MRQSKLDKGAKGGTLRNDLETARNPSAFDALVKGVGQAWGSGLPGGHGARQGLVETLGLNHGGDVALLATFVIQWAFRHSYLGLAAIARLLWGLEAWRGAEDEDSEVKAGLPDLVAALAKVASNWERSFELGAKGGSLTGAGLPVPAGQLSLYRIGSQARALAWAGANEALEAIAVLMGMPGEEKAASAYWMTAVQAFAEGAALAKVEALYESLGDAGGLMEGLGRMAPGLADSVRHDDYASRALLALASGNVVEALGCGRALGAASLEEARALWLEVREGPRRELASVRTRGELIDASIKVTQRANDRALAEARDAEAARKELAELGSVRHSDPAVAVPDAPIVRPSVEAKVTEWIERGTVGGVSMGAEQATRAITGSKFVDQANITRSKCGRCGHHHAGADIGGICVGCPCEERFVECLGRFASQVLA